MSGTNVESLVDCYLENKHVFQHFMENVENSFKLEPALNECDAPTIYTTKSRLKNELNLKDKIKRKINEGCEITTDNLFEKITDLAGVRVLHLYQGQFEKIHQYICSQVDRNDWFLNEKPIAYSWDPESTSFFESLGLSPKIKESYYTSIHYVVKPKAESQICCEIQVRTLFEEIWGEIDHTVNYPHPTQSGSCQDQLRVLSKLVSTGTRLADSIFKAHED